MVFMELPKARACNARSGYNLILRILQRSAIFAEACGASFVFIYSTL